MSSSSGSRINDDDVLRPGDEPKKQLCLTPKPVPSENGRQLELLANHFRIQCHGPLVYQYAVNINTEVQSKKLNRKIIQLLEEQSTVLQEAHIVFDGLRNIYSAKPIDVNAVNGAEVRLKDVVNTKESPDVFTIQFQFVDSFALDGSM